tara:strand:+ start:652 stop:1362 length:711 start_codon:yes stop_codon:yes gene_type:complete
MEIIPAIDLLDGQVVRLKQGDYSKVTYFDQSPVDLAISFEKAGAKRLHIVDLNGAKEGNTIHHDIIKDISSRTSLSIEVGGGIRTCESAQYYFDCGVDYIIIGSLFVHDFEKAISIVNAFPNKIIAGLDAKKELIAVDGWEKTSQYSLFDYIDKLSDTPISSIIYTDIAKDGMMAGPNFNMLEKVSDYTSIPIIASGGIRNTDDIKALSEHKNIFGCIIGRSILSGSLALSDIFVI